MDENLACSNRKTDLGLLLTIVSSEATYSTIPTDFLPFQSPRWLEESELLAAFALFHWSSETVCKAPEPSLFPQSPKMPSHQTPIAHLSRDYNLLCSNHHISPLLIC